MNKFPHMLLFALFAVWVASVGAAFPRGQRAVARAGFGADVGKELGTVAVADRQHFGEAGSKALAGSLEPGFKAIAGAAVKIAYAVCAVYFYSILFFAVEETKLQITLSVIPTAILWACVVLESSSNAIAGAAFKIAYTVCAAYFNTLLIMLVEPTTLKIIFILIPIAILVACVVTKKY